MEPFSVTDIFIIGMLISIIGFGFRWSMDKFSLEITKISDKLEKINTTLTTIEKDLRGELSKLDRRVSNLNIAIKSLHPEYKGMDHNE